MKKVAHLDTCHKNNWGGYCDCKPKLKKVRVCRCGHGLIWHDSKGCQFDGSMIEIENRCLSVCRKFNPSTQKPRRGKKYVQ